MLVEDKKNKMFSETDPGLEEKFTEAGFGFGSGCLLHPLEACYLVQMGKTSFKGKTLPSIVSSQKKADALFPFALAAYSHLRAKGRQVFPYAKGLKYLRAYAPGLGRNAERPSQLLCLHPGSLKAADLEAELAVAHLARLDLIIAHGDEKEMKFCKVSSFKF